jgi:hypothetical protein
MHVYITTRAADILFKCVYVNLDAAGKILMHMYIITITRVACYFPWISDRSEYLQGRICAQQSVVAGARMCVCCVNLCNARGCRNVCMYVFISVCLRVCMYIYIYVYVYIYIYIV